MLDHLDVVMHQRSLSEKIEDHDLSVLLDKVSLPDEARLLCQARILNHSKVVITSGQHSAA